MDFGENFGKYEFYYEDFLKNRDTRGIHDLIYLDILPKLNIYRPDLTPHDLSMSQYPKLDIAAVLLSHAHLDHCGNIGILRKDIPIVASPECLVIMKGMQDSANPSIESDIIYLYLRQPDDEFGLYLKSSMSYVGKDIYCTEPPTDALTSFLSYHPGQDDPKMRKKHDPSECSYLMDKSLPFEISSYPVDHSIFGATAYIIHGDTTVA